MHNTKKGVETITQGALLLSEELLELYITKVTAYGKNSILRFGPALCLVKMDSKIQRIKNLTSRKEVIMGDESIEDTVRDLLGYAMIWLKLTRGDYDLPLMSEATKFTDPRNTYDFVTKKYITDARQSILDTIKTSPEAFSFREDLILLDMVSLMESVSQHYIDNHLDFAKNVDPQTLSELMAICFAYLLSIRGYLKLPFKKEKKNALNKTN